MKPSVHEAAEAELLEGAKWYEGRERGLGEQFVDEYEAVIRRIVASPRLFPKLETARTRRDIRRCFLKRFPYYVAYELQADHIRVLAVAHAKRQPNYWIRRH